MWFKNIQLLQLPSGYDYDLDSLENQLTALEFQSCLPTHPSSHGWVSPIDQEDAPLVNAVNGYRMLCLKIEEKILPSVVIQQELKEKICQIERAQGRKVRQKEKYLLKNDIIQTLLPRAFSRLSRCYAYIDPHNHWLVLDTTRPKHTELFLDALKKTIPEMAVAQPQLKKLTTQMTRWLHGNNHPKHFIIEQACVLQDPKQYGRIIRCTQQDLTDRPIQALLADGCEVQQLALSWQERIQFTLTDEGLLRALTFADEVRELARGQSDHDEAQQFDGDFVIMTEMLSKCLKALLTLLLKDKSAVSGR